jgi:hypothetical protein
MHHLAPYLPENVPDETAYIPFLSDPGMVNLAQNQRRKNLSFCLTHDTRFYSVCQVFFDPRRFNGV